MDEKCKTQNGGWNWISMETEVGSYSIEKQIPAFRVVSNTTVWHGLRSLSVVSVVNFNSK